MRIESRYNGPTGSGNGGWSAGLFAAEAGPGPVEVTLRRPPPLETTLRLVDGDVRDPAGELVAEVRPTGAVDAVVPPVDRETAVEASTRYPGFVEHPYPRCFVCGPSRTDGLRIFPGRLPDGRTAAPFRAPEQVSDATVWAALDCPGGWTVLAPGRPYLLGRIAAVVTARPAAGDECVVTGALIGVDGRKALVHTSLYGPGGTLLGAARATWIARA